YARAGLSELATEFECIGDVRGAGLFFGAEMVLNRETKEPATEFTTRVANEMRREGVLLNKLGIHYNTLKIRPNMQFTKENADMLLERLATVLRRVPVQQ
ncbi:MAG: aminotransferase class III-fold pyridoxal phosphate-dependent enzyme, partial [Pikeienuella sp.]